MPNSACENGVEHALPQRAMRLSELLRLGLGDGAAHVSGGDPLIRDICLDSRTATPQSAFVAVRGNTDDGSRFARDAFDRGAVALIRDVDSPTPSQHSVARVADARAAASRLASVLYGLTASQDAGYRLCGITGTNGKSTIAYMLRSILRAASRPAALIGTIEYDLVGRTLAAPLTTPDPITLVKNLMEAHGAGARDAAIEVSSHSLHQKRVDGLRFATAIFTNLTQDHLDYHGTIENYRDAKRILFDSLGSEATAIINGDDPHAEAMVSNCQAAVKRFGFSNGADAKIDLLESTISGSRFSLVVDGRSVEFETALVGRHNISNAAAAILAAHATGVSIDHARAGLRKLLNVPGRLQRVDTGDLGFSIFVDYAHTDDALRNVLSAMRSLTRGQLICVFGCGGDRDRTKRPRMARAVAEEADRFVVTSDNPRTEDPLAIIQDIRAGLEADNVNRGTIEPNRAKAIRSAISQLAPGDTLIIAGKGHEDYQIIGTEHIHFDDVEQASMALQEMNACVR